MTIQNNDTRYSSEGLAGIFSFVQEKMTAYAEEQELDDPKFPHYVNVRSVSPTKSPGPVKEHRELPHHYRWGFKETITLSLYAPKHLPEDDPIRSLVLTADGVKALPQSVTTEIARWYWNACLLPLPMASKRTGGSERVFGTVVDARLLPVVKVLSGRVDAKKAAARKTPDQKLASLAEKHGDPKYEMAGSSRTNHYLWRERLAMAKEYYDREWERRDKYREKYDVMSGESRPQHLTFPMYLRLLAHHIEETGNLPNVQGYRGGY